MKDGQWVWRETAMPPMLGKEKNELKTLGYRNF
jgi:hypothetical protein